MLSAWQSAGAGAPTIRAKRHRAQPGDASGTRYLTGAELARLTAALDELKDQGAANAVRLLLLTGARRGELLAARWTDINLDAGVWIQARCPRQSSGLRTVCRSVGGGMPAPRSWTKAQAGAGAEWLFPPPRGCTPHRIDLDDAWRVLREAAGIR